MLYFEYECKKCKKKTFIIPFLEDNIVHRRCQYCGYDDYDVIKGPMAISPSLFPLIGTKKELSHLLKQKNGDSNE